jgi:DNA-binding beta-propeller fold protein YncE
MLTPMIRRIAPLLLALLLVLSACTSGSDTDSETTATGAVEDTESASVPAPEFPAGVDWLNTERPLTISDLEGKVVLLDFWTYGCINCIHIIPDLERLEAEFADELVVIGVHSAKFDAESNTENIRQIILRYGIEHPVVNDPDFVIWNSWGARAWPTVFVVDPVGGVVGLHAGEGVYEVVQPVIAGLIEEFEAVLDRAPLALELEADGAPRTVLSYPGKVLADEDNDRLFISDTNHHRVLEARISDGQVMAAYGSGRAGFVDGPASGAEFHAPQGLALGPGGDSLLVADTDNHVVRSIDLATGEVTTVAGTGRQAGYPPRGGSAAGTDLSSPWDLAVASDGALYVAMAGTHQIWRFDHLSGVIEPYVGSAGEGTSNSTLALSELAQPSGLAIDDLGRIFFADSESSSIRVADPSTDAVALVAGGRKTLFEFGDVDGVGAVARFQHPLGVAFADGYLWVADTYNSKIKRIDPESGTAVTLAGAGSGWSDGPEPRFYEPGGISAGDGVLYVADTNNHSIRVVDTSTGATSTLVLKGAEEFLPAAGEDLFAGTVVESSQMTVGIGAVDVVLRIEIPDGFKVNPDAPSRFDFTIDGTAASVESPGVVVDPSFPLTILGGVAQDTTELIGDVAVVYCEAEQESICLIEQIRFVVPMQPATDGPATIELDHTIELPEL